ncbi:uncharacterized protein BDCG_17917 [Blastomyces dermatitidis ER-3]|uniref:Uncharacterized protein n=3 Tax=Blastomyces TaxID=229219 RepID=A0A179U8X4_BLAGS|nr:uncharacterized protein BDBG_16111 [Blastomyces gilchristii SLH14081]XP_045282795.1 uncharacterized protein BDCG_17917 [Blastomyces dermatitidis ER-3]EQL34120.1 hypothetical protein BDFG_04030 [Blastomyces dermatitidis ATCC 26199]KMW68325.1 hypothetical protein BDDG_12736 [Blastomyces dermatitidis ATCC 18188]OAT03068.1 hypothetical protein BDCG_17917 [Blastomyces dermatitidis ER-3]OAT03778.1 hypothetical protein BDBG_16111 [Blastomyces gilchristii SLH14081]
MPMPAWSGLASLSDLMASEFKVQGNSAVCRSPSSGVLRVLGRDVRADSARHFGSYFIQIRKLTLLLPKPRAVLPNNIPTTFRITAEGETGAVRIAAGESENQLQFMTILPFTISHLAKEFGERETTKKFIG